MTAPQGAGLRRLTLRFKGELEREFLDAFFERSVRQVRVALLLGLFLYAAFGLLDSVVAPLQLRELWTIRYGFVCPMIMATLAFTFTRWFRRYGQLALIFTLFVAGVGIVQFTAILPVPANYLYHSGLILVMMFAFTFTRLRFVYSVYLSILIIGVDFAVTAAVRAPRMILINNAFFLLTAWVVGGFACYSIELYERRTFLQKREIQRKNEELSRTNAELLESRQAILESSERAQLIFSALADALPGTVLENKYQLEEKIGSGGFATVYRGRHLLLNAPVAVKIFRPVGGTSLEKSFERFRLEGISAKRIQHPNAVTVLDFGISASAIAFLVMELLEGHTLAEELRSDGKFSVQRCAEIAVPICSVLAEAHNNGILHRDIKPSNIFLHQTRTGEMVKVVDFGIAKLLEVSPSDDTARLTATGLLIGTPSYMAPERLASESYGAPSDVYSVGVLLYEMLTGHLPHPTGDMSMLGMALLQMTRPVPPPSAEREEIPAVLNDLIASAVSIDPAARPTAQQMASTIAELFGIPLPHAQAPGESHWTQATVDSATAPTEIIEEVPTLARPRAAKPEPL